MVQVDLPERGRIVMGAVVDGVEEVANITAGDIEEAPDFGASLDTEYILGMAKIKGTVKTLLDIDKVMTSEAVKPHDNTPRIHKARA